ncbi:LysR family transcriptional regulator [Micromonospora carbonacea]|uniref:DNA-binding transcriptional regulator, LysR family n=1 Tax=Micromonospora carbonacea TaxID=47853 RepID=A0A1C5ARZ9_9ACTN|nr:LysR family transcriptional regulator [Micromonospora carbonacea]SCF47794.1 DNA-binding transcriptional regulator, LysR family [Micromonospora carbonacea]
MQRDIEVKLLRALVAVVDNGGFSRAAQALHVTQPTVSQQIQRLESVVQSPLLERTNRPLRLTSAGRELVAHARRVLLLNSEVLGTLSALRGQEAFRLGYSVHCVAGLQRMLAEFAAERPELRLEIVTGLSASLADKLAREELEAAVLLGVSTPRCEMLGRLSLAWFGHAPAAADTTYPVAMVGGHSALSMRILEALAANGVSWHSVPWSADPVTVRAAVEAGLAYTALPSNSRTSHPGLLPTPDDVLGPTPEPLPVYLALSPSASELVVTAARMAARATLKDMPLVAP